MRRGLIIGTCLALAVEFCVLTTVYVLNQLLMEHP